MEQKDVKLSSAQSKAEMSSGTSGKVSSSDRPSGGSRGSKEQKMTPNMVVASLVEPSASKEEFKHQPQPPQRIMSGTDVPATAQATQKHLERGAMHPQQLLNQDNFSNFIGSFSNKSVNTYDESN